MRDWFAALSDRPFSALSAASQAILFTVSLAAGAAAGAAIETDGVIDDELSGAVVAYFRGAGLAWPHRSLEAVAKAMGADTAGRARPRLERLADEFLEPPGRTISAAPARAFVASHKARRLAYHDASLGAPHVNLNSFADAP